MAPLRISRFRKVCQAALCIGISAAVLCTLPAVFLAAEFGQVFAIFVGYRLGFLLAFLDTVYLCAVCFLAGKGKCDRAILVFNLPVFIGTYRTPRSVSCTRARSSFVDAVSLFDSFSRFNLDRIARRCRPRFVGDAGLGCGVFCVEPLALAAGFEAVFGHGRLNTALCLTIRYNIRGGKKEKNETLLPRYTSKDY